MSVITDIVDGVGGLANQIGVADIFKQYSNVLAAKYANNNTSTVSDLQNQVQLLTMQRDLMNSTVMAQANASGLNTSGVNNMMPLLLIIGAVGVVSYLVAK